MLFVLYFISQYVTSILFIAVSSQTYPAYSSLPVTKCWEEVALTPDPTAGAVLRNVTRMVEEAQERLRRLSAICKRKFRPEMLFNMYIKYIILYAHSRISLCIWFM